MRIIMPAINPDECYSRSDISRLTGRSADVVRSWEARFDLPRVAGPGHPRYRGSDVLKVLQLFGPKPTPPVKGRRGPTAEQQRQQLIETR